MEFDHLSNSKVNFVTSTANFFKNQYDISFISECLPNTVSNRFHQYQLYRNMLIDKICIGHLVSSTIDNMEKILMTNSFSHQVKT